MLYPTIKSKASCWSPSGVFRSTINYSLQSRVLNHTNGTIYARSYALSSSPPENSFKSANFSASGLRITTTDKPKPLVPNKELIFGRAFTDHMLSAEWNSNEGWQAPRIHPYQKISLEPSAMVFHYGCEAFEGMKAYKDSKGTIRLFRPDMNMKRLNRSVARLALPTFSGEQMIKCISELLKVDERWIPNQKGYSLYIRPTLIGTQSTLGVGASNRAMLFVICSPVGPYYKTGFSAVSLYAESNYARAFPGGTGDAKIGGNYAPTVLPQVHASNMGYQQILWLHGKQHEVTEVGTMNCFILWKNKSGQKELVTPPLDGTILPGVTRDSILRICKDWNEFVVSEKKVNMSELIEAQKENRLLEMFGAGTACIVSPIKKIHYLGKDISIPLDPNNPESQAGPLAKRLNETIIGIQYGEIDDGGRGWSVQLN